MWTPLTDGRRHTDSEHSSGGLVDTDALVAGLKTGMIDGAALDVFEEEPLTEDYPLLELENVWLSPHTAGSTQDAVYNGARVVVEDIAVLVGGGQPDHRIE